MVKKIASQRKEKNMVFHFVDVDECDTKRHNCDGNLKCVNVIGSFKCQSNLEHENTEKIKDIPTDTSTEISTELSPEISTDISTQTSSGIVTDTSTGTGTSTETSTGKFTEPLTGK